MEKIALKLPGGESISGPTTVENKFPNIGSIITQLLPIVFVLAGIILFIFLIIGGFGLLTSAGDPGKTKAAQGKITSAVIGFVIIFIAYWLVRIIEIMLGIQIF